MVRREMQFQYFEQPVDYAEDKDHWNKQGSVNYLYQVRGHERLDPPTGMRSAVPLGGLGSGTVELRADGSFRDWNVFNNSPAGGPKIQIDDTFFGLWARREGEEPKAWALRTHPPQGLPSISQIEYSGAFPVSRLRFSDPDLPLMIHLYGYCEFHPRKPEESATPAAIFSFDLYNPSRKALDVSVLFNVFNYTGGQVTADRELIFRKQGEGPTSGSLGVSVAGQGVLRTGASGSNPAALWKEFSGNGELRSRSGTEGAPAYGALAAKMHLRSGEGRIITFVLAWYLPYRPHLDRIPGNYYTNLYHSAHDATEKVLGRLESTWASIRSWQREVFNNSLPVWLQDALINSVATMYKTSFWFRDGRFRQWEAFSCANINPAHIDFYRSLPYAFFFPTLHKQLLSAHAESQQQDGLIPEQLAEGCFAPEDLDRPGGRVNGDTATVFILWAWQIYSSTGDRQYLDSVWTNVKKAAAWQIGRSEVYGLPQKLECAYDMYDLDEKDLVSYNAFLHLAAMLAAEKLAEVEGDNQLAIQYREAFERGQKSLQDHLWTGEYFRCWWLDGKTYPDALHADSLYGQLWAFILDLGLTTKKDFLKSHLRNESEVNGSPFGLKVMRRVSPEHPDEENAVLSPAEIKGVNVIWQVGSLDWCSLNLYLDGSVQRSLDQAKKIILNWADTLRDQWNYTFLTTGWNGYPWGNSHYSTQAILWSIPLALSGQRYYAPEGRLSFDPKVFAPAKLPIYTPAATGVLQLLAGGRCRLTVESGELRLEELTIGQASLRKSLLLRAGESVRLNRETDL